MEEFAERMGNLTCNFYIQGLYAKLWMASSPLCYL